MYKQSPTARSGYAIYKRLLGFARPYRPHFLFAILGMECYAIAEAKMTSLIQIIVDDVFVAKDMATVKAVLVTLILIGIGRSLGTLISDYFMTTVGRGLIMSLRAKLFERMLHMPVSVYDRSSSGGLLSVFTYDAEQVAEAATSAITSSFRDSAIVLAMIIVMLNMNPMLTLVFFITIPGVGIVIYFVSSRFRNVSRRIQRSMGEVSHIVNEAIEGHQVVKLFGGVYAEQQSFDASNRQNFRQNLRLVLTKGISGFIIQSLAVFVMAAIIYLATAGHLGVVTAGIFSAFITAMVRMFPSLRHLTDISAKLQKGIAAAEAMFNILDVAAEPDNGTLPLDRCRGDLEFRNVSFAYDSEVGPVLQNVSFKVGSSQTVALVGRSGSGKSTIAKLVPRFYSVQDGEILLDGHNIDDYRLSDLRDQISFVGQNVTLFNDTIANNIAYGSLAGASREKIIEAAKMAHAMEFIERLPEGLDTMVGENGLTLSGGQRQRLAIARALLKDSPILILDEATSALDTESERLIQQAIETLIKDRTTLVIAHRLSTVENADRIVVLDAGKVVEKGDHGQLLKRDEHYASLYKLQFNLGESSEPKQQQAQVESNIIDYPMAGQNFLDNKPQPTIWETLWYGYHPLAQLLAPIGYLFNIIVAIRRALYRLGVLKKNRAPVPVIVVGNVTVGGTGKTPLVIWLANHLTERGYRPGIISRGYKGKSRQWPLVVTPDSDSELTGDEALMIARRTRCPLVIGPQRDASIRRLLEDFDCNVIISDDGLQHYAMERDIEIVVADGARGFGNGMMLPAGPMREPKSRLKEADYIITNGARLPDAEPMQVKGERLRNLFDSSREEKLKNWRGRRVHAVAAIGNPERFFELLRKQGLIVIEHAFEDHHAFSRRDIVFGDELPVLMTEKDAVKCARFAGKLVADQYWYVPVAAHLSKEFVERLDQHIENLVNGQKAA